MCKFRGTGLHSARVFAQTKIPSVSFRGWINMKHWSEKFGPFYLYNCLFLILITNGRCSNSGVLWAVQSLIKCSQSAGLLWSPWGENSIMRPKALWLHPISNFTLIIFFLFFIFLPSTGVRKTAFCFIQTLPVVSTCCHSRAAVMSVTHENLSVFFFCSWCVCLSMWQAAEVWRWRGRVNAMVFRVGGVNVWWRWAGQSWRFAAREETQHDYILWVLLCNSANHKKLLKYWYIIILYW